MRPPSRWWTTARALLPGARDYAGLRSSWRHDVLAGITVGVVALPLALAFGISSGVGAAAGLVTAIVAGIVAAVFGGSHVQVSGPTGAMAVVLAPHGFWMADPKTGKATRVRFEVKDGKKVRVAVKSGETIDG